MPKIPTATIARLGLSTALLLGLVLLLGCSSGSPEPDVTHDVVADENARGSGSIGGWRARPGQRTIFDRGFRIPTTITFRADAGNWSGNVSIVDRTTNRSLCQRNIFGGGQTSCSGIQGNFRLTVENNADSRDTATGQIRFNN